MTFIYCSYRIEQAVIIPFQSNELSNEFAIYKRLVHTIDIHHKGMESVFIKISYNIGIININYAKLVRTIIFVLDYAI